TRAAAAAAAARSRRRARRPTGGASRRCCCASGSPRCAAWPAPAERPASVSSQGPPEPSAELEPLRGLLPRLGPALEARLRAAARGGLLAGPAAAALARVLERAADPADLLGSLDELGLRR